MSYPLLPLITTTDQQPDRASAYLEQELTVQIFTDHFSIKRRNPDFSFLGEIVEAYTLLPYENITKIIAKYGSGFEGQKPRLRSPTTVISDYIRFGSGGTCYSLTHTLATILDFYGFNCRLYACDMGPHINGHCALIAETIDGKLYYVDPGYLLSRPLAFTPGQSSFVDNGFAIVQLNYLGNNRYSLITTTDGDAKERYQLKFKELTKEQFIQYWYDSFNMPGLGRILVTTYAGDRGRLYLHHNQLRHVTDQGLTKESMAATATMTYGQNVEKVFGISAGLVTEAQALLKEWKRLRNQKEQQNN